MDNQQKIDKIDKFDGDYRFLSNFYPAEITIDGIYYPTVEHAYQAAKSANPEVKKAIACLSDAGAAKHNGRKIVMREGFEEEKLEIMKSLLVLKFLHPHLRTKLLETGDLPLEEGNWWGDTFWGVCRGVGENHLGKLLMELRQQLRERQTKRE